MTMLPCCQGYLSVITDQAPQKYVVEDFRLILLLLQEKGLNAPQPFLCLFSFFQGQYSPSKKKKKKASISVISELKQY